MPVFRAFFGSGRAMEVEASSADAVRDQFKGAPQILTKVKRAKGEPTPGEVRDRLERANRRHTMIAVAILLVLGLAPLAIAPAVAAEAAARLASDDVSVLGLVGFGFCVAWVAAFIAYFVGKPLPERHDPHREPLGDAALLGREDGR